MSLVFFSIQLQHNIQCPSQLAYLQPHLLISSHMSFLISSCLKFGFPESSLFSHASLTSNILEKLAKKLYYGESTGIDLTHILVNHMAVVFRKTGGGDDEAGNS